MKTRYMRVFLRLVLDKPANHCRKYLAYIMLIPIHLAGLTDFLTLDKPVIADISTQNLILLGKRHARY
jgi:hypothetical protein